MGHVVRQTSRAYQDNFNEVAIDDCNCEFHVRGVRLVEGCPCREICHAGASCLFFILYFDGYDRLPAW